MGQSLRPRADMPFRRWRTANIPFRRPTSLPLADSARLETAAPMPERS